MDTNNPGSIEATMGDIEDRLANIQNQYAELAGQVKRQERFMDVYEATLYQTVKGAANPTERKVIARSMLADDEHHENYLDILDTYEKLKHEIQILDIRRSIGQSLIKLAEQTGFPRHGKEAKGQAGQ